VNTPEHIELFLRGNDAINRLDVEATLALVDENTVFEPLRSQTEGAFIGVEGMRRFLADTAEAFDLFKATRSPRRPPPPSNDGIEEGARPGGTESLRFPQPISATTRSDRPLNAAVLTA
jgi:hypothetical protein